MQRDWIDYASAAGSIATAITLIYLIYKEWKTRKHVTDLSALVQTMTEQNKLLRLQQKSIAAPKFVPGKRTSFLDFGKSKMIILSNEGKEGRIGRHTCSPEYAKIRKIAPSFGENDTIIIFLDINENHQWSENDWYNLTFEYFDLFDNTHALSLHITNKGIHQLYQLQSYEEGLEALETIYPKLYCS